MASLLLVTNGPAGMRFSAIELGRRLQAAGHAVTVLADGEAEALVRHHGLAFRCLDVGSSQMSEARRTGWIRRWRQRASRREAAIVASGARGLVEHLRSVQPDLILLDGEMQEHVLVAAASGVPLALMNTFCSIWRQAGSPPPHTTTRPGEGWLGSRPGAWLAWTAFLLRKRLRERIRWFREAGGDPVSVLRALADEQGFDFRRGADAGQWLMPRTYPAFPALSLHAAEFEFSERPPENVVYTGPQVLRERLDPPLEARDRERLDELVGVHGPRGRGRPLVYGGFGSFFTAEAGWVGKLFDTFRERPDWSLVLPVGGRGGLPPGLADRVPANVHVFDWLPQLEVLPHCDVAVVHGGINTIDECVLARVPMLVCNGRETDMPGNQARVVHHGLGLAADPGRDGPPQIRRALEQLQGDSRFVEALERQAEAYERYERDRMAERAIENLLDSARRA
ncbi:MAG: glycosyltransferase [Xanthomonadales bacterium]|jgi:UDP:flavonoid glycosyltransferase YjiC (YdhE family)|nr:glycosyltransferase [Xanthomonadales bacterium]